MARVVVYAAIQATAQDVRLIVSVSGADDGLPRSGLASANFDVVSVASGEDTAPRQQLIAQVVEGPAGIYQLVLERGWPAIDAGAADDHLRHFGQRRHGERLGGRSGTDDRGRQHDVALAGTSEGPPVHLGRGFSVLDTVGGPGGDHYECAARLTSSSLDGSRYPEEVLVTKKGSAC